MLTPQQQQFHIDRSLAVKMQLEKTANQIKDGLGNISNAVQSAGKEYSLKIQSVFERNDIARRTSASSAANKTSPEEARQSNPPFVGALTYPAEMKYFTMFAFRKYDRKNVLDSPKETPSVTIVLPMPNNLSETFSVDYQTPAMGPLAGAAIDTAIGANRDRGNSAADKAAVNNLSGTVKDLSVAGAIGLLKTQGAAGDVLSNAAQMASGVAPNPYLAVIFSNIGLREHSFSYKFAPNSRKEMENIKQIIRELKLRMLPGMSGSSDMLFTFPDTCDISFGPTKNKPYKIKSCVMKSISVNYSPNGSPAFFKTGDPVMIEISMTFMEMSPFTRHDLDEPRTYNPPPAPPTPTPVQAEARQDLSTVNGVQYDQMGNVIQ